MITAKYPESSKALEKAADAIEAAKYNLKGKFYTATANRAYYACYYCMIALLYTQNIYAKTHQGTRTKFYELFIKTSILPIEISTSITMLFDYRQQADYDLDDDIDQVDAENIINKASEIYHSANNYFQQLIS